MKGCLQRIEEQRDAAGTDWKSAVYRKVQEEVKADRGLIVLSVLQRLSGSGQEETDGSHENEGIVLPAHRQ